MDSHLTDVWAAPTPGAPVDADIRVPGSKSITNRALILGALADGPSVLRRPLHARDTELMAAALRALGTEIIDEPEAGGTSAPPGGTGGGAAEGAGDRPATGPVGGPADGPVGSPAGGPVGEPGGGAEHARSWLIRPGTLRGPAGVDCGLAGTVMRFVPPVAALADGDVAFDGDPRARERPMTGILDALRALGGRIDDDGRGALPFTVRGTGALSGGTVEIDASASSQFVSALLLSGARYDNGVTVHHVGKQVPSLPHIKMTVEMLRRRGVTVDDGGAPATWRVEPGPIAALDEEIEPDLSNAAPFLAAALVTGGRVRVLGWPEHTTQAGDALREIFGQLGGHVRLDSEGLTVRGGGGIVGVDLDLHEVGELTPVIAAVAALASEPSHLRGIAHLRNHETDRLAAIATELSRLGAEVKETEDGLEIVPRPLRGTLLRTYDDHRMAHAAAVLGLAVRGVRVENIATTRKTLPDFAGMWDALLAREVVS